MACYVNKIHCVLLYIAFFPGVSQFFPVFSGARVVRSLILCVKLCRSLLVLQATVLSVFWPRCFLSFGHCVFCPLIYCFCLRFDIFKLFLNHMNKNCIYWSIFTIELFCSVPKTESKQDQNVYIWGSHVYTLGWLIEKLVILDFNHSRDLCINLF